MIAICSRLTYQIHMNFTRQWTLLLESLKIFALNMFQKRQRVAKNSETYIGFTTLKHVKNVGSSSKFSHFRKKKPSMKLVCLKNTKLKTFHSSWYIMSMSRHIILMSKITIVLAISQTYSCNSLVFVFYICFRFKTFCGLTFLEV